MEVKTIVILILGLVLIIAVYKLVSPTFKKFFIFFALTFIIFYAIAKFLFKEFPINIGE